MIFKYISIGLLNSILGLSVIIICVNILNINYNISYFIGYIIGLINSFILNKKYTFKSSAPWKEEIIQFINVFLISYGVSHFMLINLIENLKLNQNMSILLSMIIYTLIGYILNKKVFKGSKNG
jgi:putative flippase GtrA